MTLNEIERLVKESGTASIGFLDKDGNPGIRRIFSTWHKGVGGHLISTNTSSQHTQALLKNNRACLYFDNCRAFRCVCLTGTVIVHFDHEHKAMIWNEGDEKYYPNGVDDEDYCVLEFQADHGRYYSYNDIGNISAEELTEYDKEAEFVNCAEK